MANHNGPIKLFIDLEKQISLPSKNVPSEVVGDNSIIATGLTDEQVQIARMIMLFPFYALYWPLEYPSLDQIAEIFLRLFGERCEV